MRKFGIGADEKLGKNGIWDGYSKDRNAKSLYMVNAVTSVVPSPVLDVGAGNSLMRKTLQKEYDGLIETSDIDLDHVAYPENWTGRFGTIFSFETLEHLLNPLFHLEQLRRIIKPGGFLFIVTPNDNCLFYKSQHLLSIRHPTHFHRFNTQDLFTLLDMSGWKVRVLRKFHRRDGGILSRISLNGIFVHAIPT